MKNRVNALLLICLAVNAGQVYATSEFGVGFGYAHSHDDNVFRLDAENPSYKLLDSDDSIQTARANLNYSFNLSRQNFLLKSSLFQTLYTKNKRLNNTGASSALNWRWALGSQFSGVIGAGQKNSLNDFAYQVGLKKNIITTNDRSISGEWLVNSLLKTGVGVDYSERLNGLDEKSGLDHSDLNQNVHLSFTGINGLLLGLTYTVVEGKSLNDLAFIGGKDQYQYSQYSKQLSLNWKPAAKLDFGATVAAVTRLDASGTELSSNNYNVKLAWSPTFKTNVALNAYNRLSASLNEVSTYTEYSGYSLTASYQYAVKLTTSGAVNVSSQSSDLINKNSMLIQEYIKYSLSILYQFSDYIKFDLSYINDQRRSETLFGDYDAQNISAGINLTF